MVDSQNTNTSLTWLDNGTPVSERFDDSYFSKVDGREETREVFITGNLLPDRWKNKDKFAIAELGFGTGLNFFETAHQWHKTANSNSLLTFVSFEQFPIMHTQMIQAIHRWPDLVPYGEAMENQWPPSPGENRITFKNIELHLFIGDAREQVKTWDGQADAWYLDGFSPAKNPELWSEDLLKSVYEHTVAGGTFSTFTSAGWVKRNLTEAGFEVTKVPGFLYKKERLQGQKD